MKEMNAEVQTTQEVNTNSAQEPEINEADGEPIFHAPEEESDRNE